MQTLHISAVCDQLAAEMQAEWKALVYGSGSSCYVYDLITYLIREHR